jgi:transposase-like protein
MQDKAAPPDCHPRCPACDVPMWLVRIERTGRSHFECKACGATTVEPAAVVFGANSWAGAKKTRN